MAIYESFSQELILNRYKENASFSYDEIINNDLTGIKFPRIHLDHVKIFRTYLDRALLTQMECVHTSIEQSNCNELQAGNSSIESSLISASNIIKADFTRASLGHVRFDRCVAHSIKFSHSRITSCTFYECQMYKAYFDGSILINVVFEPGSKGDLSTLQKARFTDAMICDCSFANSNCMEIDVSGSVFIGCDFTGARMDNIDFSRGSFINCTFDDTVSIPGKLTNSPVGSTLF